MCVGYPEVCPSPTCTQPLNPSTNKTFEVLGGLFKDLTGGQRGSGRTSRVPGKTLPLPASLLLHRGGAGRWAFVWHVLSCLPASQAYFPTI